MERWVNLLGYQAVWLITVSGARHGTSWPACCAAGVLCAGHLMSSSWKGLDVRLMASAALLGAVMDGLLASSGLLHYFPATPAVPLLGCPLWILALWLAFSTTLTRSLGWLRGRTGTALVFGAVGGPLAYWTAAQGWGVIEFQQPQSRGLLTLAIGWSLALAVLMRSARSAALSVADSRRSQQEPQLP